MEVKSYPALPSHTAERAPDLREPGATEYKWVISTCDPQFRNVIVVIGQRLDLRYRFLPCGHWVTVLYFPALQWVIIGGCAQFGPSDSWGSWSRTVAMKRRVGAEGQMQAGGLSLPASQSHNRATATVSLPASRGHKRGSGHCRVGCMVYRQLLWAELTWKRTRIAAVVTWE